MADWDFILAPSTVAVEIVLDEVAILGNSLKMLAAKDFHSGLHEWISSTANSMTPEQRKTNDLMSHYLDHLIVDINAETFPEFIAGLDNISPERMTDIGLHMLRHHEGYPGDEEMLSSKSAYLDFVEAAFAAKYAKKGEEFNRDEWAEGWELLQDPQRILDTLKSHLQYMWDTYLQREWIRTEPMLQEAVDAFSAIDYTGMSAYDAIETVTGRNMRGKDFFEDRLEKAEKLIFMPSAYLGPYISWGVTDDERTMLFFFGARPPKHARATSPALSRSELLVRLNALADETRLKILELLTEREELCAQDFINELDLSQSSASRHLRQLTASGYLNERRRDVAKCYSLNLDRIDDTIQALKGFLKKA